MSTLPPANPNSIDPLLQARLDRLQHKTTAAAGAGRPNPAGRQGPAPRKAKPAKASKVAALALSTVTTLGLAAAFANSASTGADSVILTSGTAAAPTATTATTAPAASSSAAGTGVTTATVATTAAAAGGTVVDGTYVGDASSNRFGTVQVQVVYSGGAIADVQILSYPNGDNKSVSINQRALPTLISEALSAQSANVDTVSGATYTTNSYKASLQSAIDNALTASGLA